MTDDKPKPTWHESIMTSTGTRPLTPSVFCEVVRRLEEESYIQELVNRHTRTKPFVEQLAEIDPSVKFLASDLFEMVGESSIQTTVRQQGVINALRQLARRFQNEKHNVKQSLRSLRLRHEELQQDYDAMRQERDSLRDAWEDSQVEVERLKAFIEGHGL